MKWEGEEVSRGKGQKAGCRYHSQPVCLTSRLIGALRRAKLCEAVFHEGSKGYLCCKRRVLEFSEFLKIEGCTTGSHLFVGAKKEDVGCMYRS